MGGRRCGGSVVSHCCEDDKRKYRIRRRVDDYEFRDILWNLEVKFFAVLYICRGRFGGRNRNVVEKMVKKKKNTTLSVSDSWIYRGHGALVKKGYLRGSTVVEAAYLFPMIMLVWMLVLFALFYYHDKNILAGASYETAVVGSELAHEGEIPEGKLAQYFQERIKGKLIFFGGASVSVNLGKNGLEIEAKARARNMSLAVRKSAAITEPEKLIRKFRIARQRLEEIDK